MGGPDVNMLTMGQLDVAAKAYRSALAGLASTQERARAAIGAARERVERARTALAAAIVDEANQGTAQVEIIKRSGYSRERVRTILRSGGVEAD